ncbi:hypothetical protein [Streptomyces chrestomyceticus]|uniref:hypothetical protein n=1 Tax=Streptomyces chrestomyceticus TaxID=68185 RepID=UPI0039E1BFA7
MATALNVRRATVVSWEKGQTEPRPPQREAYARLLDQLALLYPATDAPAHFTPRRVVEALVFARSVTDPACATGAFPPQRHRRATSVSSSGGASRPRSTPLPCAKRSWTRSRSSSEGDPRPADPRDCPR